MMLTLRSALALVALCLATAPALLRADAAPAPIPLEHFFAEPDIRSVQLSPDGQYLAFLTTLQKHVGIALMTLATGKVEPLVNAGDENIQYYFWKGNDYIVYGGDLGGNESAALRSIQLSKRKVIALAESYREQYSDRANWANVIDTLRMDPEHIMVFGPKAVGSFNFQTWLLDVRNGERRPANSGDDGKRDSGGLIVDTHNVARARSRYDGDKFLVEVRRTPESTWSKAAEFPADAPRWNLVSFGADGESLYLINTEEFPTGSLHAYNVRTGTLGPALFHSPEVEIDGDFSPFAGYDNAVGVIFSYDRSRLYGVTYSPDKTRFHFFDQGRAALQAQIDATLPNALNLIVSTSADEKLMVVLSTGDRDPGTFYILDLKKPRLMAIGKNNRYLSPAQLQPMEPVKFAARDGLQLHAYLTRPPGAEGKRVPLIINPHGGPFGPRDFWHYNNEVQFLASRGYAVLQVNYRGSGGYGENFLHAGYHEWGGKMQDDLTDAVQWAVAQGIADPARVAIYGASYGGYAALAGATFTPDLYRCAANYVGVSDLGLIAGKGVAGRGNRGFDFHAHVRIGDEPDYLRDRSPLNFVERIKIPTLHAYGYNDPRVDIKNWTRLEPKLKQFGKTYEILIEGNEGHGFKNESNRIEFYRHLEAFLAKYMDPHSASVEVGPTKVLELPAKNKSGQ